MVPGESETAEKADQRLFPGTSDNACDRKRPERFNQIWSYDLLTERLENGRAVKLLTVIDEFTRESLAIDVGHHVRGEDVVELLRYLFAVRGEPDYIRSDNGPEFTCRAVRRWLENSGVKTLFVAPGSPWENGYIESFNGKLRDELLNRELFLHIDEMRYVVDRWRMDYNHYRPHSSLDYMSPAAFAATAQHPSGPQSGTLPPGCPNVTDCPKDLGPKKKDVVGKTLITGGT